MREGNSAVGEARPAPRQPQGPPDPETAETVEMSRRQKAAIVLMAAGLLITLTVAATTMRGNLAHASRGLAVSRTLAHRTRLPTDESGGSSSSEVGRGKAGSARHALLQLGRSWWTGQQRRGAATPAVQMEPQLVPGLTLELAAAAAADRARFPQAAQQAVAAGLEAPNISAARDVFAAFVGAHRQDLQHLWEVRLERQQERRGIVTAAGTPERSAGAAGGRGGEGTRGGGGAVTAWRGGCSPSGGSR